MDDHEFFWFTLMVSNSTVSNSMVLYKQLPLEVVIPKCKDYEIKQLNEHLSNHAWWSIRNIYYS